MLDFEFPWRSHSLAAIPPTVSGVTKLHDSDDWNPLLLWIDSLYLTLL